ncbi:hypothetical protein BH11CYA1_BH11CYA1_29820 [soil metagenome]
MKMEAQSNQDLPLPVFDSNARDSAAVRMLDEASSALGQVKDFRPDSGDKFTRFLPPILLEHTPPVLSSSFDMGSGTDLHSRGLVGEKVLPSGDTLRLGNGYQNLSLPDGESISVSRRGGVSMFDANGKMATVTEERATPPDMMPSLIFSEFSNGVKMTSAGGLSVLSYPNGARVYIDHTGLRAIDRENQPRVQLDARNPDFDFRGFK